jgi:hypothetical protein
VTDKFSCNENPGNRLTIQADGPDVIITVFDKEHMMDFVTVLNCEQLDDFINAAKRNVAIAQSS